MVYRPERLPPTAIPVLQEPGELERWHEQVRYNLRDRGDEWPKGGDGGYNQEIERHFGPAVIEHCTEVLKRKKGDLKIVSLGGGQLAAILELRARLELMARELGLTPNITIVENALTKGPALKGLHQKDAQHLVEDGTVTIVMGTFEVVDTEKMQNADLMLSVDGVFTKALNFKHELQMFVKSARCLAPGGKTFFQFATLGYEIGEAREKLQSLQNILGSEYLVIIKGVCLFIDRKD